MPTVAYDLLTHPDVHPDDLATLIKPRVGGAAMPESVKLLFEEQFGVKPATSYALTEGPTLVARQDPDLPIIEGSCGRPLPHIEVQVLDEDDQPVPTGEVGEICFGPPPGRPLGRGLPNHVGATGAAPTSRLKRCEAAWSTPATWAVSMPTASCTSSSAAASSSSRGGNNIYPAEVERVLGADVRVAECCVVGRADDRLGEVVVAYVQPAAGVDVGVEDLIALCRGQSRLLQGSRRVLLCGSLSPHTLGQNCPISSAVDLTKSDKEEYR